MSAGLDSTIIAASFKRIRGVLPPVFTHAPGLQGGPDHLEEWPHAQRTVETLSGAEPHVVRTERYEHGLTMADEFARDTGLPLYSLAVIHWMLDLAQRAAALGLTGLVNGGYGNSTVSRTSRRLARERAMLTAASFPRQVSHGREPRPPSRPRSSPPRRAGRR